MKFPGGRGEPACIALCHPYHLGDAVQVLPTAAALKARWPSAQLIWLGEPYTEDLLRSCAFIDRFVDAAQVLERPQLLRDWGVDIFLNFFPHIPFARAAWQASVPIRVANLRRLRAAIYCNRFFYLSPRGSGLHTAQIHLQGLRALGFDTRKLSDPAGFRYGLDALRSTSPDIAALLDPARFNLIVHPKSKGEGREWPLPYYLDVLRQLPPQRFRVLLTGVNAEAEAIRAQCPQLFDAGAENLMGRLKLPQFLQLLAAADGILSSSTGPVHIGAALGIHALGVYACRPGLDAGRWGPIGPRAEVLVAKQECPNPGGQCPLRSDGACVCIGTVEPAEVVGRIGSWKPGMRV